MTNTLETLVSKSLKFFKKEKKLFGYKFYDHRSITQRRPADFIVSGLKYYHLLECKEVTRKKNSIFKFDRIINSGQLSSLQEFSSFKKEHQAWILINFNNRKVGKDRVDEYFIVNIDEYPIMNEWIDKESMDLADFMYYNKQRYENNLINSTYEYNMIISKVSNSKEKGRILVLTSCLI